jgi:hypothetical protein
MPHARGVALRGGAQQRLAALRSRAAHHHPGALLRLGPDIHCPPCHLTHLNTHVLMGRSSLPRRPKLFEPSFLECNGILRHGE